MKYSLSWLSEYVPLSSSPEKLVLDIEATSFEVEGVERIGETVGDKIVVAEVLNWQKHPNADRLRVVKLKVGKEIVDPVVCGATNFDVGHKVCLALSGATIPGNGQNDAFTLGKSTIRGVESQGMLCSAAELGLLGDSEGILLLSSDAKSGQPAGKYLKDVLLDINTQTTNRGDVQSYLGMAREISAITGRKLAEPEVPALFTSRKPKVPVKIEDKSACLRYTGAYIENISVCPSPEWMQSRLRANNIKPINNIVDVTNYVMLEIGLPLHAFDAEGLKSVVVRRSKKGEKMTTLADSQERVLPEGSLLITESGSKAIALAGVIGSAGNRAVSETTTAIFLEAAKFDPISVRASSRATGIRTESSSRFEKNPSIHMPPKALARAIDLIVGMSDAKVVSIVDVIPSKSLVEPETVGLSVEMINRVLSTKLLPADVKKVLSRSGFESKSAKGGHLVVTVPYWRTDIHIQEDLIEEVGRLYGYANIKEEPLSLPNEIKITPGAFKQNQRTVKDILTASGFWETRNYSFVSGEFLEMFGHNAEEAVEIINPIVADEKYLRPSLLLNLIRSASGSFRKYNTEIRYFEAGNVFSAPGGKPQEYTNLAAVTISPEGPEHALSSVKGGLELFAQRVIGKDLEVISEQNTSSIGGVSGVIKIDGRAAGQMGILNPLLVRKMGLKNTYAAYWELENIDKLLDKTEPEAYCPAPRFPGSSQDITLTVDDGASWTQLRNLISSLDIDILKNIELLGVYRDRDKVDAGKKNVSIRIFLQNPERTLTDEEIAQAVSRIQNLFSK